MHFFTLGFSFFRSGQPYVSDKTILLINGDVDFCRLHGNALEKRGFKVLFAYTLESAQFQLITNNPHIILLDNKMPDGRGTGFLEKNKSVLEHTPVILITGDASSVPGAMAMKSETLEILRKPFPSSALNKMIYLAANFFGHE